MREEHSDGALLAGDAEAFGTFYARHVDVVRAYVARRVRRADLTFDLVAETFARALQARHRYDPGRGPAIAWLLTIARNLLADAARRRTVADATRRKLGMERIELPVVGDDDGDDDAFVDPARLAAAIDALPEDQRDLVLRRVVEDESYPDLAASTGCSEQVVRKRVSRGLAAVRRQLTQEQA